MRTMRTPQGGDGLIRRGRLTLLPVVHYRMEFAWAARRAILQARPAAVAVDLPRTLEQPFLRAVDRLPRLSVLVYPLGKDRVYLPVEVTDPVVEALRTADEIGARRALLEPDLDEEPDYREPYPDPYAATRIGLGEYVAACRKRTPPLGFQDQRRAAG